MIYLYTFYHCYTSKCAVVFSEKPNDKKMEYLAKLEEIKSKASPSIKNLISSKSEESAPKPSKEAELLTQSLLQRIDLTKTVFTKPLAATYIAAVKKNNVKDFLDYWSYKMWSLYRIECLNPTDPNLTDEIERQVIQSQLARNK